MKNKMKVLFCDPLHKPKVIELEKELDAMQKAVGGYIQAIYPFKDGDVALVCNDEGKFNGTKPNRKLWYKDLNPNLHNPNNSEIFDVIYGNFFICAAPEDSESFEGLSEQQIATYFKMFEKIDFPHKDNQKKPIDEIKEIKKYKLNFDYSENTIFAIDMAKEILENLNNGEYDDLDSAIMQELDSKLIYYVDQWDLLKTYQTPQNANYNEAIEMLISELYNIITEERIVKEFNEQEEER